MDQLEASKATFNILNQSQFQLPDEAADTYWLLQRWPLALQDELDAAAERIRGYRGDFQQQLQDDQQQLQADLQELQVRRLTAQRLAQSCPGLCFVCGCVYARHGWQHLRSLLSQANKHHGNTTKASKSHASEGCPTGPSSELHVLERSENLKCCHVRVC